MCVQIFLHNNHIYDASMDIFQIFVELYLQSGLLRLKDYPQPFWLALFVEGTRFTQAKLLAAQEYATTAGLPVPRNVLIPRTKVKFSSHILLKHMLLRPNSSGKGWEDLCQLGQIIYI